MYTKITSTLAHNLATSTNTLHTMSCNWSLLKLLLMLELIYRYHTHSYFQVWDDNVGCNDVINVMYDIPTLLVYFFYDHILYIILHF